MVALALCAGAAYAQPAEAAPAQPAVAAPAQATSPVPAQGPAPPDAPGEAPSAALAAGEALGTLLTLADFGLVTYDVVYLFRGRPPARGVMQAQLVLGLAQGAVSLGITGYLIARGERPQLWIPALGLAVASGLLAGYAAARLHGDERPACLGCLAVRF